MKAIVLHNEPGEDAAAEDRDVLDQRDAVVGALRELGHEATSLGCTLDLGAVRHELSKRQPDVVFNLVESLGGTDRLMTLVPLLLDAIAVPYTGATTRAILATSDKLSAKKQLSESGLPTPAWHCRGASSDGPAHEATWIVKAVWEHASFGMDDTAVVSVRDFAALDAELQSRERQTGKPHFAETFIPGREFNLSMLAGDVLSPAEIDFSAFPPDKPRIVGRQAKWEQGSFEYDQTPRRFDFPAHDRPLLEHLSELAVRCWRLFGLTGYARVDFRVDGDGRPWILEVNVNPCLSPDAGFAAALTEAGIGFNEAIQRIINEAVNPSDFR